MTGVAERLAAVRESPPVQRVRTYRLSDADVSPRPRDLLVAMRQTDGEICVRWTAPAGVRFARYASESATDADWQYVAFDRVEGTTVERIDAETLARRLRGRRPELLAYADARAAFASSPAVGPNPVPVPDGGPTARNRERVRVERYDDLLADTGSRRDADALAAALPTATGEIAFRLPPALAAETVLEPVEASDRVFVAEPVPERGTDGARYVRQGRRSCRIPRGEATVYERTHGASVDREHS